MLIASPINDTTPTGVYPTPLNDLDATWFRIHPDRQFRLRKQSPAELQQWPVPPERDATGWCIIRKHDGAMELFALAAGETWGDSDEELGPFFDHLRRRRHDRLHSPAKIR